MPIEIKSTKDVVEDGVNVIVYSRAGIGKTSLIATAPTPLTLSAESGLLSLRKHDLPYIEINTFGDLQDSYEFITSSAEAKQYETICLDSVTEIAEVLLSKFKSETKDPRKAYGNMNDEMATIIRAFRDLKGKNKYFSAKEARVTDEYTGVTTYRPMMPGKTLLNGLGFYPDELFALRIGVDDDGESFRYLQTQPDVSYDAKDRSGALSPIEKPDLTYIFNKIKNS